jgi:hypothetical protein
LWLLCWVFAHLRREKVSFQALGWLKRSFKRLGCH